MRIRYQADNDLSQHIVSATRRLDRGIDFRTAVAAGLHEGIKDPEVLAVAAEAGRILVTHDRKTMPHHFAEFIAGRHSPGVIVIQQRMGIGRAAEWLHLIWSASEAEEYADSILILD